MQELDRCNILLPLGQTRCRSALHPSMGHKLLNLFCCNMHIPVTRCYQYNYNNEYHWISCINIFILYTVHLQLWQIVFSCCRTLPLRMPCNYYIYIYCMYMYIYITYIYVCILYSIIYLYTKKIRILEYLCVCVFVDIHRCRKTSAAVLQDQIRKFDLRYRWVWAAVDSILDSLTVHETWKPSMEPSNNFRLSTVDTYCYV